MLDHVAIPVSDIDASRRFYEPVLDGLGVKVVYEAPGFVLFGNDDGFVGLRQKEQVLPIHVAFRTDRPGVDAFYANAMAAGGKDNGAPVSGPTTTPTTTRRSSTTRMATTSRRSVTSRGAASAGENALPAPDLPGRGRRRSRFGLSRGDEPVIESERGRSASRSQARRRPAWYA